MRGNAEKLLDATSILQEINLMALNEGSNRNVCIRYLSESVICCRGTIGNMNIESF